MSVDPDATVHWPVPPQDGYRFRDLFTLPDLPEHTELIDGSLVFMAPQANAHGLLIDVLVAGLRAGAPPAWRVRNQMNVRLTDRTAPEPDILVVRAEAVRDLSRASFEASDVLLVVEVVSPSSLERDRDTKPHKYAGAGIPHFWRVEWLTGTPTVITHRLGDDGRYHSAGEHVGRLTVADPFPVDADLMEIERL